MLVNGWPNGYAFILSFLAPVWTIGESSGRLISVNRCLLHAYLLRLAGAYDSPVHISEEATNARTAVPFAIISSAVIAGLVGWGENML